MKYMEMNIYVIRWAPDGEEWAVAVCALNLLERQGGSHKVSDSNKANILATRTKGTFRAMCRKYMHPTGVATPHLTFYTAKSIGYLFCVVGGTNMINSDE